MSEYYTVSKVAMTLIRQDGNVFQVHEEEDYNAPYLLFGGAGGLILPNGEYLIEATPETVPGSRPSSSLEFSFTITGNVANVPAEGAPAISGTARVGETLTAVTSAVSDANGILWESGLRFQWLADDTEIEGATQSSHTLTAADVGKAIKVRIRFYDGAGFPEQLTSEATAVVAGAEPAERPSTPTGLSGDTSHDRVILSWDDPGDASIDGYMILRRQHDTHAQGQFSTLVEDTGTAATAYTDAAVNPETRYTYRIKAINEHGESERSRWLHLDTPTAPAAEPNSAATGKPAITGTVQVGETLTADVSSIADEDGLDNASFSYQWLADDEDISGATSSSYTPAESDEGRALRVRVSFTDGAGNDETLTSPATAAVTAQPASGTTEEPADRPQGLRASAGEAVITLTWNAPDDANAVVDYRILRHRPEEGEPEPLVYVDYTGSRATTYTDTAVQPETLYVYRVQAADVLGFVGNASDPAPVRMTGSNSPATGAPAISGTAQAGETLTADSSAIADADGLDNATFTYQWLADGADISGATGSAYALAADDVGKTIKVRVSFTDDAGNDEALTSTATAAVEPKPNSPATGAPTITGTARVGQRLTADTSSIADDDGLGNASFRYQWLAGNADIAGATNSTYTLADADEGKAVKVSVSFTDDAGNDETLTSAATDTVASSVPTEPPPAKPRTLRVTEVSHDKVTLTWRDPQDNTITGYIILRRDKAVHSEGTFETVEANTGTADTTYTDTSVDPEKRYVYRIKAINDYDESEISSWVRAYTPAAPTPENIPATGAPTIGGTLPAFPTRMAWTTLRSTTSGWQTTLR